MITAQLNARHWTRLGFAPDSLIYQADVDFTMDDVKDSLFGSTTDVPVAIQFNVDALISDAAISVVVTSLRQVWITPSGPFGIPTSRPWQRPEWVIEGWVQESRVTPHQAATRIRAHLITGGAPDLDDSCYLQVIEDVTTPRNGFDTI